MESLALIQRTLNVPKNQLNKFGGYKYRSCEDILEAVKPLLGKATLTLTDDVFQLGDRFYIKATAQFKDGGYSVTVSACAREPQSRKGMDEAQITGSTSSYARKYALNGLFCLSDTHDPDSMKPPTNGGSQPSSSASQSEAPSSEPTKQPPKETPGEWPAPTQNERKFLNMLRDFYKSQLPGRKFSPTKLLKLSQLHMARFPNSDADCGLCKQYINAAEVME